MGLAALFAACENNENEGPEGPEPREQVGRTVLVYIVGDNGVSELSSLFKVNFSDMKAGMEEVDYSKCNLVVYRQIVMGLYFCLIALHGCRPVIMRTLAPSDIIVGLR